MRLTKIVKIVDKVYFRVVDVVNAGIERQIECAAYDAGTPIRFAYFKITPTEDIRRAVLDEVRQHKKRIRTGEVQSNGRS